MKKAIKYLLGLFSFVRTTYKPHPNYKKHYCTKMLRKKNIEIDTKTRTIFITEQLTNDQKKYCDTLVSSFGYAIQTKMSFESIEKKKMDVLIVGSSDVPKYYENCIPSSKTGLLIHEDAKLLDNEVMQIKNIDIIHSIPEFTPPILNARGVIPPSYYKK